MFHVTLGKKSYYIIMLDFSLVRIDLTEAIDSKSIILSMTLTAKSQLKIYINELCSVWSILTKYLIADVYRKGS